MTQKEFQAVFREQVRQCEGLLIQKAKEYTGDNPDRLSAFKAAAAIQDSTPQRALAGMMAKHIISIYDSATPYQWKHMIGQRTCRRNTDETRFVLLKIWTDLYALDPELFGPELTGPFCQREGCREKDMSCGCPCEKGALPLALLHQDYPAALEGGGL